MKTYWVVPAIVASVLVITSILVTQNVRFGCVDLGIYKSCGVSQIK